MQVDMHSLETLVCRVEGLPLTLFVPLSNLSRNLAGDKMFLLFKGFYHCE